MTLKKQPTSEAPAPTARAARKTATAPAAAPAPAATTASPAMPSKVRELGDAASMDTLARELKKFITTNGLSSTVNGKEFVNVEGWQFAGSRMGIVPVVEHVINLSNEQEIKYQAKVTLLNIATNATVGAGFAICSNKESGRKFYQEFAIASMAQTRAIGKAFRNMCAWMIRAAGYEATPLEEMEYTGNGNATVAAVPVAQAVPVKEERPRMYPIRSEAPEDGQQAGPVKYATGTQKQEITNLLEHPLITRQEKTKMLTNLNRLDEERATQAIAKLKKAIEDREGTTSGAA